MHSAHRVVKQKSVDPKKTSTRNGERGGRGTEGRERGERGVTGERVTEKERGGERKKEGWRNL